MFCVFVLFLYIACGCVYPVVVCSVCLCYFFILHVGVYILLYSMFCVFVLFLYLACGGVYPVVVCSVCLCYFFILHVGVYILL